MSLRTLGRWIADWRNGATIIAAILVGLLTVVVVDSIQGERDARQQQARLVDDLTTALQELERRGGRVDALIADRDQLRTDRDAVTEELRTLRELLIDQDLIEPRPAPTAGPAPAGRATPAPRPAEPSAAPEPSASPSPRPSPPPSPSPAPCPVPELPLLGCPIPR